MKGILLLLILLYDTHSYPYFLYSYYRQFLLYKYIFCPKEKLIITQTMPQEIEIPLMPTYYQLDEGVKIVEPKVEEIVETNEEES